MKTKEKVKAGDGCPQCGGDMVLDQEQLPETLIDRRKRNSPNQDHVARYAERTREKAADFGLIHKCVVCGYRARFQPAKGEKAA